MSVGEPVDPVSIASAAGQVVDDVAPIVAPVAAMVLSRRGVARLLGPSVDVVAQALARQTEASLRNVGRVAEGAVAKSRSTGPGSVSPRAAVPLIEAACYADDEVVAEYLSGVLAASRSSDGRDDRAVGWTAMISRLSAAQLRLHFLIYASTRTLLSPELESVADACKVLLFVPYSQVWPAMELDETDQDYFIEAFYGLAREGLVGREWAFGDPTGLRMWGPSVSLKAFPEAGFVVQLSRPGLGLWLWGLGYGTSRLQEGLRADIDMDPAIAQINVDPTRCFIVAELPDIDPTGATGIGGAGTEAW